MIISKKQIKCISLDFKLELQQLIHDFMLQPDVISGRAFIMGDNVPNSWYEAISTTGFCVKVSEVFLERMLAGKPRFANAETMSISLDPNLYGKCGDGSNNAWHTCCDTGTGFIVDLTIAQFGSKYNNHFLWFKSDWLKEFQASDDTHDVGLIFDPENIPSSKSTFTKLSDALNKKI